MGYASRLSPEAKHAEYAAALRRSARSLQTAADLEGYLSRMPESDREAMRNILTPLCRFTVETLRG